MFTLAMVSLPAYSAPISSSAGAIALHGPHHSAQKSTSTGPVACSTSTAKEASVTGLVFSLMTMIFRCSYRERQLGGRAESIKRCLGWRGERPAHGGRATRMAVS